MRDGVNLSNQTQIKQVVTASHIMMLNDLEAYLKFPQNLPVTKVKFDYTNIESQTEEFVQKIIKPTNSKPTFTKSAAEQHDHAVLELPPILMPTDATNTLDVLNQNSHNNQHYSI